MTTQLDAKDTQKQTTPSTEIFTSRKHSMDYFTTDGVILRTGYKNKLDWYLLPLREMLDNSADFLWKYYKGSDSARIDVKVRMTNEVFYLTVRNSNPTNVPLFSNLKEIFDYEMRYGSKQDVHIISRGMLGDAMKQVLSLGYVLLHIGDDGTAFTDKQWKVPLIIRHNRKQAEIYLTVDKAAQRSSLDVKHSEESLPNTDTEIKLQLPVIDEVRNKLDRRYIEMFCRKYSLLTTDISFKFQITDDITHSKTKDENEDEDEHEADIDSIQTLNKVLKTVPEKGILTIDVPAIHPIAADWKNSDFIHSYKPDEFMRRITNVHDKTRKVYEVLQQWREGTNLPKTSDSQLSIAELLDRPDRDKIIKKLFDKLHKTLDAPSELSLPYTTNPKKRCDMLVERIGKLYDIDTTKKPAYQLVRGLYSGSTLQYPTAFEIIAIPFKEPFGPGAAWDNCKSQKFIGAVNYSVSPRDNNFEGKYEPVKGHYYRPLDIKDVLNQSGFQNEARSKNRLPCIIVGNVITPRRDPQGYDKSSIDTTPFVKIIMEGVERITPKIQTYRADGWTFHGRDDEDRTKHDSSKMDATELLRQFLIRERGLPE